MALHEVEPHRRVRPGGSRHRPEEVVVFQSHTPIPAGQSDEAFNSSFSGSPGVDVSSCGGASHVWTRNAPGVSLALAKCAWCVVQAEAVSQVSR
jgi:hypothetical protein